MKNKNELVNFINLYNGKMNVYYTIYDFEEFRFSDIKNKSMKVDTSVILDRAFLDFDAHGDIELEDAFEDFKSVVNDFNEENIKYEMYFSGKGFHVIVYGKKAKEIREIQAWFRELKGKGYKTLDDSGIQTTRFRRVPNTVNMSSSDENGEPYFCIPILLEDLTQPLDNILNLAKSQRFIANRYGSELIQWPSVKPIEVSDIEIDIVKPVKSLPILPCLHSSIMVQNPGHYARVYLVHWYRDLLSMGQKKLSKEKENEIIEIIMSELRAIAEKPDVWLDWDEKETRFHVSFVVRGGYSAPSCYKVLIPQGYCVGKCWRYHDVNN